MTWTFPHEVDGWLSELEGRTLALFALGRDVLEIGSYCGKSTICMAQVAKSVVAVDPHNGDQTPDPRDTLAKFRANLKRYDVAMNVFYCHGTVEQAGPVIESEGRTFDMAFIDGAHDVESVRTDIRWSIRLLKPEGLLVFHDYRWGTPKQGYDAGVEEAVNDLLTRGAKMLFRAGSLAVTLPAPSASQAVPAS